MGWKVHLAFAGVGAAFLAIEVHRWRKHRGKQLVSYICYQLTACGLRNLLLYSFPSL